MKRIVSFFLAFCILISSVLSFSISSFALVQADNIAPTRLGSTDTYYSFDAETKTLTISGTGKTPDFTNSSGSSTSQPWFSWRSDGSIENVVVEEGVTALGAYIFYYVKALNYSLPETLKTIGRYSFAGSNGTTSIALPSSLETIGEYAFYNSLYIESVNIPSTVTSIGASAFEKCSSIKEVNFENSNMKISISSKAFLGCASLSTVTLPKRATLYSYSFGYYSATSGSVYEGFLMRVFRDSPGYTYAEKYHISYELISGIDISEAQTIDCTYFSSTTGDEMEFYFVPTATARYDFYSQGSVDVDCRLLDEQGNVVASASDNSVMDLNFTLTALLQSGKSYRYVVNSVESSGDFNVTLFPHTIEDILFDFDISLDVKTDADSYYDIPSIIYGESITVVFDSGYSEDVQLSADTCVGLKHISYTDNQDEEAWSCGNHIGIISSGDFEKSFNIEIRHNYISNVVEPTDYTSGYTSYSCLGCGDEYVSDYQKKHKVLIEGNLVVMEDMDESHPNNFPVAFATVSVDGKDLAVTDENGCFSFYVDEGVTEISFYSDFAITKTFKLNIDENNDALFPNEPIINFDYHHDGYINMKDYVLIYKIFGEYDLEYDYEKISVDYNRDGVLNEDDFQGAGAFNFFLLQK